MGLFLSSRRSCLRRGFHPWPLSSAILRTRDLSSCTEPKRAPEFLKEKPFLLSGFFVLLPRRLHRFTLGNLRDRDIPPRFIARHALIIRSLHHHYAGSRLPSRLGQCAHQFV